MKDQNRMYLLFKRADHKEEGRGKIDTILPLVSYSCRNYHKLQFKIPCIYYLTALQYRGPKIKVLAKLFLTEALGRTSVLVFSSFCEPPAFLGSQTLSSIFKSSSLQPLPLVSHCLLLLWPSCFPFIWTFLNTLDSPTKSRIISPSQDF